MFCCGSCLSYNVNNTMCIHITDGFISSSFIYPLKPLFQQAVTDSILNKNKDTFRLKIEMTKRKLKGKTHFYLLKKENVL